MLAVGGLSSGQLLLFIFLNNFVLRVAKVAMVAMAKTPRGFHAERRLRRAKLSSLPGVSIGTLGKAVAMGAETTRPRPIVNGHRGHHGHPSGQTPKYILELVGLGVNWRTLTRDFFFIKLFF